MANIVPDSFKTDLLKGTFNFDSSGGSTFKLALYTDISGLTTSTTAFTTSNEVSTSGTSYSSGGNTLTNNGVAIASNIAFVDFADLTFSTATITARGCMIYNDTATGDPAVAVFDFGGDKTSTAGSFTISFPTADASNAVIRIA